MRRMDSGWNIIESRTCVRVRLVRAWRVTIVHTQGEKQLALRARGWSNGVFFSLSSLFPFSCPLSSPLLPPISTFFPPFSFPLLPPPRVNPTLAAVQLAWAGRGCVAPWLPGLDLWCWLFWVQNIPIKFTSFLVFPCNHETHFTLVLLLYPFWYLPWGCCSVTNQLLKTNCSCWGH